MLVSDECSVKFDIERREKLSYEEFARNYLFANKPVIVTDVVRKWKAVERWTPEFFRREFGDLAFTIENNLKAQAGYKGREHLQFTMRTFIDLVVDSSEENPAPYLRNKILYDMFPSLKEDIEPLPEYFLPNWLPDRYFVKDVRQVLNRGAALEIYIGGKGGAFPVLHYDGAATHAFLMQIHGKKEVILFSPAQSEFLYPSPEKDNLSSINSLEHPDFEKFPLFAKAVPSTFIIEPGDLLFIPSGWWHTVRMLTPSITISANVLNRSNWNAMVDFVASRRRNPAVSFASRVYLMSAGAWRSWRDRSWQRRAQ